MAAGTVVTLDMGKFFLGSEEERAQFARDLLQCFASQGFVKLVNHGVPDLAIDKAFEWNRTFFELPEDIKKKYPHPPCANPNRGWVSLGQEKSSAIKDFEKGVCKEHKEVFDVKESFDIGNPDDPLYGNIWPDESDVPGFRSFMEIFYELLHVAHLNILKALEMALSTKDQPFEVIKHCMPNVSEMRLNYYPKVDIRDLRSGHMSRISEHTDFGTVTLLFQDSVGGLEVEDQSNLGTYFPVTCENKHVMLVNIGDSLQRLTNDYLTSVSHRVTLPISEREREEGQLKERMSVTYFAKVARDNSIYPFGQFVTETNPAKYPHMTAYEWNQIKLEKIYGAC
ncbi:flavonol synthase/flavanone 3-hydroxylase [Aspergillus awamori]|uniref:Flavonol synthase/flavanone 3-hydroxylase n=1 Tax=Aspergillus awamori TaxID=105351 RepID=A0A401L376_ASPAW|nr:flavonol synthase/flavanone 3-hydroxylase [Aspergillus awamori]GKZ60311.1 hypothetical protein AnigIFM49718_006650 [Aspergillus niger]